MIAPSEANMIHSEQSSCIMACSEETTEHLVQEFPIDDEFEDKIPQLVHEAPNIAPLVDALTVDDPWFPVIPDNVLDIILQHCEVPLIPEKKELDIKFSVPPEIPDDILASTTELSALITDELAPINPALLPAPAVHSVEPPIILKALDVELLLLDIMDAKLSTVLFIELIIEAPST